MDLRQLRIQERRERKKTRNEYLEMHLNGFRKIRGKEDWIKGLERCLRVGAEKLETSENVIKRALEISKEFKEKGDVSGKSRIVTVGACLYIASILEREKITQLQIARGIGVTEASIRQRYKEILQTLGEEELTKIMPG